MRTLTKDLEAMVQSAGRFSEYNQENQIVYFVRHSIVHVDENGVENELKKDIKIFNVCDKAIANRKQAMSYIYRLLRDSYYVGKLFDGKIHSSVETLENGFKNYNRLNVEFIVHNRSTNEYLLFDNIEIEGVPETKDVLEFAEELKWYRHFNYATSINSNDRYVVRMEDVSGTECEILTLQTFTESIEFEIEVRGVFEEYGTYYYLIINRNNLQSQEMNEYILNGLSFFSYNYKYARFAAFLKAKQLKNDDRLMINGTSIQIFYRQRRLMPNEMALIYDSQMKDDEKLESEIKEGRCEEAAILRDTSNYFKGLYNLPDSNNDYCDCIDYYDSEITLPKYFTARLPEALAIGTSNIEEYNQACNAYEKLLADVDLWCEIFPSEFFLIKHKEEEDDHGI